MVETAYSKQMEAEMSPALRNGEFQVYLQPKVNMITSKVFGAEALSRWVHPVEGIRSPLSYIPLFEENGFVVKLDMYVFEEICKLKQKWYSEGVSFASIPISINMSRLHLFKKQFVDELFGIVSKYGVNPSEIEIEITESVYLNDYSELIQVVGSLQEYGFTVSIDDFGSGYSALNMLKDIPVDTIKIDKEFLQLSANTERGKKVIKNVIILCKDLKLHVTVEGVETQEQIEFLTNYGCEIAQGFFYSKPIPIGEFEEYTNAHYVVSVDVIKFSFNDNLKSDDNRFEAEYTGEECRYVKGISPSIKAVHFPGGNAMENCLLLPTGIIHNDSYSVSMWIKPDRLTKWTATVFGEYENGFFQFCPLSEEGVSCFRIRDRRVVDSWHDTEYQPLQPDKWYHVVITYNRMEERATLYINGVPVSHSEDVPALYFLKRLMIGGDIYKPTFAGSICEVIFFDKSLKDSDVADLYENYITMEDFEA